MINTMIVEDQKMIRGLLEIYLRSNSEFRLVASVGCAAAAPDICRRQQVDLILMDVMTENEQSGLEAARVIKSERPNIKIVIVTSLVDDAVLEKARQVGADSLWYKDADEHELMNIAERTVRGEHIFPDSIPAVPVGFTDSRDFTVREKEVLHYLIRGFSYRQIADELGVEVPTVKYHVTNMLQKTGCKDKLQLALAVQNAKFIVNGI